MYNFTIMTLVSNFDLTFNKLYGRWAVLFFMLTLIWVTPPQAFAEGGTSNRMALSSPIDAAASDATSNEITVPDLKTERNSSGKLVTIARNLAWQAQVFSPFSSELKYVPRKNKTERKSQEIVFTDTGLTSFKADASIVRLLSRYTAIQIGSDSSIRPDTRGLATATSPSGDSKLELSSGDRFVDVENVAASERNVTALNADVNEIVFIDKGIDDWQPLVEGVSGNAEVVLLATDRDGVAQIAEYVNGRAGITAIHVVSHGSTGKVFIGNTEFSNANVGDYGDELGIIAGALEESAGILLYGCHTGAGGEGEAFINTIAEATGAGVAASEDLTGADDLGGDWELEAVTGVIGASPQTFGSAPAEFTGLLGNPNPSGTLDFGNAPSGFTPNFDFSSTSGAGTLTVTDTDDPLFAGFSFTASDTDPSPQGFVQIRGLGSNSTNNHIDSGSLNVTNNDGSFGGYAKLDRFEFDPDDNYIVDFQSIDIAFSFNGTYSVTIVGIDENGNTINTINTSITQSGFALDDARVDLTSLSGASLLRINTDDAQSVYFDNLSWTNAALPVTNAAPTFNSSTTASIAENTSTSTTVLDVNADDGDGGSNDANVTYSLSGTDAGDFDIDGSSGVITFTSSPDFENPTDDDTNNDYELIVTADDGGSSNNTASQDITITVTDANDPPTDISLSSNNIDESATGVNANVGSLTTTDADVGDTHTYTLVAGTGDTDNGSFTINGSNLSTSSSLTAGNYSVRINTNDGTADYAEAFNITVNDDIAPSGYTVTIDQSPINAGNDNAVSFTFAGAEIGSTYDYEFTSDGGAGSVSNSGIIATATDNITGVDLSGLPDGIITLSVTLTDTNSNEGSAATDTATKDANAPVVNSVNVPLSDTYVLGQDLDFTVNFDENITVNTTGGTSQISLTVGPTSRQATYQSGSGTQSLVFSYSVQDGDADGDGIAVGTLSANGGTLQDAAGNDANLTLNSLGSTSGVNVLATDVTYTAGNYSPTDPSGLDLSGYTLDVQDGTAVLTASTTFDEVTVQPDAVLDLDADLSVNNELLFQSDASGTAQLADATGVNITGDVTVERFIPVLTEDTRGYRFLTSAVDSHASIFDNWQEGGSSPAGLGTHIAGNNNGSNGLDQTITGNPSMYTFDNQNSNGGGQDNDWQAVTNTKAIDLVAGEAYRIFIRGDRNYDLDSNPADPPNSDVTLRATGSLALGDQSYDLNPNQDEYSLVGNPYQAIVDMNTVMSNTNTTNVNTNYYWVWDPNMSPGGAQGAYVAIDLSTGNSQTPGGSPSSSAANQFVMPGQSFFVQTTSNSAADLEFTEASKDVSPSPTAVFSDDGMASINLKLYKTTDLNNDEFESDALQINFDDQFANAVTLEDADKLGNPDENLARLNNGEYLTIEKRAMPVDGETLAIFSNGYTATDYTLVMTISNMPQDVSAYLMDDHTGDQTLLNDGENQISFTADPSSPGSIATDRFSIEFEIETFGVEDNEAADNFKVYPNPVDNDQITIQAANMSGEVDISLSNMLGQRVMSTKGEIIGNGEMTLNIGDQQSGVYFIEVAQDGQSAKERLIIK